MKRFFLQICLIITFAGSVGSQTSDLSMLRQGDYDAGGLRLVNTDTIYQAMRVTILWDHVIIEKDSTITVYNLDKKPKTTKVSKDKLLFEYRLKNREILFVWWSIKQKSAVKVSHINLKNRRGYTLQ